MRKITYLAVFEKIRTVPGRGRPKKPKPEEAAE